MIVTCKTTEVCRHLSAETMMFRAAHSLTHLTFPSPVNLVPYKIVYGGSVFTMPCPWGIPARKQKLWHIKSHVNAPTYPLRGTGMLQEKQTFTSKSVTPAYHSFDMTAILDQVGTLCNRYFRVQAHVILCSTGNLIDFFALKYQGFKKV